LKLDIWGAADDPNNADGFGLRTIDETMILELVPPVGTVKKIAPVKFSRFIGFNAVPGPYSGIPPKYRWGILKQNAGQILARILGEEFCDGALGEPTFANISNRLIGFARDEKIPLNVGRLPIASFAGIVGVTHKTLAAWRIGDYGLCTSDGQINLSNPAYPYNKKRYAELAELDRRFASVHSEPQNRNSKEWQEWNKAKNDWKWEEYEPILTTARIASINNLSAGDGFSMFTAAAYDGVEEYTIELKEGLMIGLFANGIISFKRTHPDKARELGREILQIYQEETEAGNKNAIEAAVSLMRRQQRTECSIGHRPSGVATFITIVD